MSLFRANIALLTQAAHDTSDDDWIGGHGLGENLRCDRPFMFRHVEKDVQNAR
ncbi:hypothetical protein D3C80_2205180 [compost metagenome]